MRTITACGTTGPHLHRDSPTSAPGLAHIGIGPHLNRDWPTSAPGLAHSAPGLQVLDTHAPPLLRQAECDCGSQQGLSAHRSAALRSRRRCAKPMRFRSDASNGPVDLAHIIGEDLPRDGRHGCARGVQRGARRGEVPGGCALVTGGVVAATGGLSLAAVRRLAALCGRADRAQRPPARKGRRAQPAAFSACAPEGAHVRVRACGGRILGMRAQDLSCKCDRSGVMCTLQLVEDWYSALG